MRIAIVGGGIVGLTTALSLAKVGLRATVYEAVRKPQPLGVGINVLPHAMREVAELGLLDKVRTTGVSIEQLTYRMADGREVWTEGRGLAGGYDWPQVAIHRGRLQMLLLAEVQAALGADAVRFGHALAGLTLREGGAVLSFIDRETGANVAGIEADLVIAADGIHSAVRKHFYPDEGIPKWNGVSLFRGTTVLPKGALGPLMHWTGHSRQKFAGYPIAIDPASGEILFNWICDLRIAEPGSTPREDWNRRVDRDPLLPRYAGWRWPGIDVPAIVSAATDVFEFPMVDRDPLPRWTHGRVTLAGDAAHPMYPIGSNGATQGILDARCLAYHLATAPDVDEGLARYETERRETTSRIVLTNRAHGPDKCLEIAMQRAPTADVDLGAVFPVDERAKISQDYKVIAGFDPQWLRERRSYTP
ncbi:MAG: 3-hydroxybenzoate 6-hydroxylase [Pseudomonadota bacterium]|jgi:2-polyprenyl-6-methoxyphenol hydroxylase-like FAD-dependent oxidoreductase